MSQPARPQRSAKCNVGCKAEMYQNLRGSGGCKYGFDFQSCWIGSDIEVTVDPVHQAIVRQPRDDPDNRGSRLLDGFSRQL